MEITLKVMNGDLINIFGKSYYFQNNTSNEKNYDFSVESILEGLLGGTGTIDIQDVEKFPKNGVVTAQGKITHEIYENKLRVDWLKKIIPNVTTTHI